MEQIIFPTKIECQLDAENKNRGQIIIEPCYPGYGITWGNALRRILLSSLEGAAVTAVRIKGAKHEFSTIPHVKEDILQIILNLKLLRLKVFKDEPIKLKLSVKGERKITAGDIEKSADVEIVNPNLHIATLTEKKAELDMEITVAKGHGYVPSEEKDRTGLDLGTIVVDSIFSPVVNVAFRVDNVRFGKRTDYDKLTLNLETDATINPFEAFMWAGDLLVGQFKFLTKAVEENSQAQIAEKEVKTKTRAKTGKKKKVAKKSSKKKK